MKKTFRHFLFSVPVFGLLVFISPWAVSAQIVTNVIAQQQSWSDQVSITYDLADENGMLDDISVRVSNNGGRSYDIIPGPEAISGDVGRALKPGSGKKIIWDVSKDFKGLSGSLFRVKITVSRNHEQLEAVKVQEEATETYRAQLAQQEKLKERQREDEANRAEREKQEKIAAAQKVENDRKESIRQAQLKAQRAAEAKAEAKRQASVNATATAVALEERRKLEDLAGGDAPAPQKKDDILKDISQ